MAGETKTVELKIELPVGAQTCAIVVLYRHANNDQVLVCAMEEGGPTAAQASRIVRTLTERLDDLLHPPTAEA